MKVLIVESRPELGRLWKNHLERRGMVVRLEQSQPGAVAALQVGRFDIMVLNVVVPRGSAFAIADLASYRHPGLKVIFVTSSAFFSDGSIFNLSANACAYLQSDTPPDDLAAMVEHYGARNAPAGLSPGHAAR